MPQQRARVGGVGVVASFTGDLRFESVAIAAVGEGYRVIATNTRGRLHLLETRTETSPGAQPPPLFLI